MDNSFWKSILNALSGAAAVFFAYYAADWIANRTYRVYRDDHTAPQRLLSVPAPHYAPPHRHAPQPFAPRSAFQDPFPPQQR